MISIRHCITSLYSTVNLLRYLVIECVSEAGADPGGGGGGGRGCTRGMCRPFFILFSFSRGRLTCMKFMFFECFFFCLHAE